MYLVTVASGASSASRLAVSVPARLGSAVRRNRARRRARAVFGPLLPRLSEPSDLLVTVRAGALDAAYSALVRSAEALARDLGVLDPER